MPIAEVTLYTTTKLLAKVTCREPFPSYGGHHSVRGTTYKRMESGRSPRTCPDPEIEAQVALISNPTMVPSYESTNSLGNTIDSLSSRSEAISLDDSEENGSDDLDCKSPSARCLR